MLLIGLALAPVCSNVHLLKARSVQNSFHPPRIGPGGRPGEEIRFHVCTLIRGRVILSSYIAFPSYVDEAQDNLLVDALGTHLGVCRTA